MRNIVEKETRVIGENPKKMLTLLSFILDWAFGGHLVPGLMAIIAASIHLLVHICSACVTILCELGQVP